MLNSVIRPIDRISTDSLKLLLLLSLLPRDIVALSLSRTTSPFSSPPLHSSSSPVLRRPQRIHLAPSPIPHSCRRLSSYAVLSLPAPRHFPRALTPPSWETEHVLALAHSLTGFFPSCNLPLLLSLSVACFRHTPICLIFLDFLSSVLLRYDNDISRHLFRLALFAPSSPPEPLRPFSDDCRTPDSLSLSLCVCAFLPFTPFLIPSSPRVALSVSLSRTAPCLTPTTTSSRHGVPCATSEFLKYASARHRRWLRERRQQPEEGW